jgi:hypothetical protein
LDLSSRIVSPHRAVDLDITILGSCPQLISLDLSGRLVRELSPLVGCRELQELHTIHCQYIGPMDCMRQCPRLYILTMVWSYASGHVSADRCVHFTTADRSWFARRTLTNHERRLRKLLRRWEHFTKIEGMTAVADFLLAKQRHRGQYYRGREKGREVDRQRERGHGRPLTVEDLLLCNVRSTVVDHVRLQLETMWMRVIRNARWPTRPQTPQLISTIVTHRVDTRHSCTWTVCVTSVPLHLKIVQMILNIRCVSMMIQVSGTCSLMLVCCSVIYDPQWLIMCSVAAGDDVDASGSECTVACNASDATADFNDCDESGRYPTFM